MLMHWLLYFFLQLILEYSTIHLRVLTLSMKKGLLIGSYALCYQSMVATLLVLLFTEPACATNGVSTRRRRGEGMQLLYSCIEGDMLAVTKFKSKSDTL